ncbi:MAG: glutathione S-transferase family protein [Pseudomonadota bacterium]
MLTLHIANKNYSSWSLRPWLLMQALDIPFTEKLHPFPADGVWDIYRTFSPSGKVPCLVDGDLIIWDSLAITEYLAEQHDGVWPADKIARTWARCAAAEMHSGFQALRNNCGMSCGMRVQLNNISAALQKDISRIDELWCEGLKKFGGPFLAGKKFSAVDAFFSPVVFRAQTYHLPLSDAAKRYTQHLLHFPAMKNWYDAALIEVWREPAHEQDVLDAGAIVADHRR